MCLIGFNYAQPFLITAAIDTISGPKDASKSNDGYGLIGATGLIYLGIAVSMAWDYLTNYETDDNQITTAQYQHHLFRSVTIFRGAVVSLIYAKTLEMRAGGVDESAALTLMSTDIDRLAVSLQNLCEIWARIIEMGIGIWLLERELGWVCVAPIILTISQDPRKVRSYVDSAYTSIQFLSMVPAKSQPLLVRGRGSGLRRSSKESALLPQC